MCNSRLISMNDVMLQYSFFYLNSLPLMCIAPLGKDALECLRYTDGIEKSVRSVLTTSWPPGIVLIIIVIDALIVNVNSIY